jgi:hypothetical protein
LTHACISPSPQHPDTIVSVRYLRRAADDYGHVQRAGLRRPKHTSKDRCTSVLGLYACFFVGTNSHGVGGSLTATFMRPDRGASLQGGEVGGHAVAAPVARWAGSGWGVSAGFNCVSVNKGKSSQWPYCDNCYSRECTGPEHVALGLSGYTGWGPGPHRRSGFGSEPEPELELEPEPADIRRVLTSWTCWSVTKPSTQVDCPQPTSICRA